MATSGSTNYAETTRTIIKDALVSIGANVPGEDPEHEVFQYAQRQLNRLIKSWEAKGYHLFRATEGEITIIGAKRSYTMGGVGADFAFRPLRIEHMRWVQIGGIENETPEMSSMSRQDYLTLPQKDAPGTSTEYYYDPQIGTGVLFIWPVLQSANGEKIRFTYQRDFQDFDNGEDNPDLPQEWFDAIVKSLASNLAYALYPGNVQIQGTAKALADEALALAESFDIEYTEVIFTLGDRNYK